MLQINNLSIYIQNRLLVNNINLSINKGEMFALLGESGSGKSLTALSIMRLLPGNALYGAKTSIKLEQQELLDLSNRQMRSIRRQKLGMIFQDPMTSLNPVMTIGKQLAEALHDTPDKDHLIHLLERVKIPDPATRLNCYPHELSGGMKQRVIIAMALASKPSLLIADEPTTALDVTTQAEILLLLREIVKADNMSLLFITHDLALAAQNADQIAVMQKGNIVEQGPSKQFFSAAQDPYSQKLLQSLPDNLQLDIASPGHEQILRVNNLRVYFPIRAGLFRHTVGYIKAVDDASFVVNKGETLAVVGESGSGKTTLGKAILGLVPETQGSIDVGRERLQVIFQDPFAALDPKLRIYDSLTEGIKNDANKDQAVDRLLLAVGLPHEYKWRFAHELSGGERQRVCIARALTVKPDIIICDEPTSSLDVSVQAQVLQLLVKLQREYSLTYIFITHDISLVRLLAHRVVVIYQGKIVETGAKHDVLASPQHEYTKKLLNSVPTISPLGNQLIRLSKFSPRV